MTVSLAPWAWSQCDTTCVPRPKLNAQQPLVQQISKSDRASRATDASLRAEWRIWVRPDESVTRAGFPYIHRQIGVGISGIRRQAPLAFSTGDRRKELPAEPATHQSDPDDAGQGCERAFEDESWIADLHAQDDRAGGEPDA